MIVGKKSKLILVRSITPVSDSMGGFEYTEKNKKEYSGVLSNYSQKSGMTADRYGQIITHKFYMDYPKDEIIPFNGENLSCGSRTFKVINTKNPNNTNIHIEIELEEII